MRKFRDGGKSRKIRGYVQGNATEFGCEMGTKIRLVVISYSVLMGMKREGWRGVLVIRKWYGESLR